MIKAVVFDLDDTIAPEKSFVKSGYRAVAEFFGTEFDNAEEELWQLFCESPQNVFNRFYELHGRDYTKEDILTLIKLYREHEIYTSIYKPYPDVLPLLTELRGQGIKLGVLSDGFLISQQHKVTALKLHKYFDEIILTDELGREYWKPNALGFLKLCDSFNIAPEEMLYIGDNPKKDFYVKTELPIKTARILRTDSVYEKAEYMEGVREDYTLTSLSVKEIINNA